ncbi:MAG TPA: lipase family protein [Actinomycetota bacterium]
MGFALLIAGIGATTPASAEVLEPQNDPFYQAPAGIEDLTPGTILRSRQVDVSLMQVPLTGMRFHAYQLLYRTGDVADRPIANVTTLIVPDADPPAGGRQLVSLQNAENSLDPNCAPSYQLQVGQQAPSGAVNRNLVVELTAMLPEIAAGRVLVIPDPLGPDKGYIVRLVNAHMVLDSIRAAESFEPAGLSGTSTPVALFGYSGGAFESAAANEVQPTYAPELNVVAVAAGGVPVGNLANVRYIDGTLATGTLMAVGVAINRAYPEMDLFAALNQAGAAFADRIKTGCSSAIFAAPLAHFDDWTTEPNFFARPIVRGVLEGNQLGQDTPTAPTFYYNAINDEIIWIAPLDALVAEYCAAGANMFYVRDPAGVEHIQGAANFIPMALDYIEARFAGLPIPTTCGLPTNAA